MKEKVGPLKDKKRKLIVDSNGMCQILNDFFSSVFTKEKMEEIPEAICIFKIMIKCCKTLK